MVFQSYALYPHMSVRANHQRCRSSCRGFACMSACPCCGCCRGGAGAVMRGDRAARSKRWRSSCRSTRCSTAGPPSSPAASASASRSAAPWSGIRDVFLMDEPLSNLDAKLRVHMRTELAELHQRLGATFIYVTHDQVEAMTMSDRVAMMDSGDILQLGTPSELYAQARERQGRAVHRQPGDQPPARRASARAARVELLGRRLPLDGRPVRRARRLTIGIRPEAIARAGPRRGSAARPALLRAAAPQREPRRRAHPPLRSAGRRSPAGGRPRCRRSCTLPASTDEVALTFDADRPATSSTRRALASRHEARARRMPVPRAASSCLSGR